MENRILYRCPVCDMPMLEKIGLRIFLLQHYNRRQVKAEVERDLNAPQSVIRIRCGACKIGAHIFAHINEVISAQETFTIRKDAMTADNPVDKSIDMMAQVN